MQSNSRLVGENACRTDVNQPWEQDNQAWWDWYVSLADNSEGQTGCFHDIDPLPAIDLPTDEDVTKELRTPYRLRNIDCDYFRANGHIKLQGVLSPGVVLRLRHELVSVLGKAFQTDLDGGATERFLSLEMVWLENPLIREYVLSARIAEIAAELLHVRKLRLYHDNVLSKEPGCGRTPWHYDDHHFPLATNAVVTAWIPAQPVPAEMGPLAFAKPINVYELVKSLEFNKFDTSYDRCVSEVFRQHGVSIENGPFAMGEVSFHHNLSFHSAAANRTRRSRIVLANTYYADGARIVDQPTMVSGDWRKFIPGAGPGDIAASELNPVCWPAGS